MQVVDGVWHLEEDGVRTAAPYYDPPHDTCYYPDSGKLAPGWQKLWGPMTEKWHFWQPLEGAEYFTGEE